MGIIWPEIWIVEEAKHSKGLIVWSLVKEELEERDMTKNG